MTYMRNVTFKYTFADADEVFVGGLGLVEIKQ